MAIWDAVRNLINQWPAGEQSAQTTALRNCMCTIRGGAGYWDGGTNSESTPPRIRCRLVDLAAGNVAVVVSSPVLGLATIAAGTNVDNVVVVTLASDGRGGAHPRRYWLLRRWCPMRRDGVSASQLRGRHRRHRTYVCAQPPMVTVVFDARHCLHVPAPDAQRDVCRHGGDECGRHWYR
jgi:hypothetical protein